MNLTTLAAILMTLLPITCPTTSTTRTKKCTQSRWILGIPFFSRWVEQQEAWCLKMCMRLTASQLVFDRLGDQRCWDNSSLLHGLHRFLLHGWCRRCCCLHSRLHCLHGGHGSKSRVLKTTCRKQIELLEPTTNHISCTNKHDTHQAKKMFNLCTQTNERMQ